MLRPGKVHSAESRESVPRPAITRYRGRVSRLCLRTDAVHLQIHALAHGFGNFLRTPATPEPIKNWSKSSFGEKLISIGAKAVIHTGTVVFQMAEVVVPKILFAELLQLTAALRSPPDPSQARAARPRLRSSDNDGRRVPMINS